MGGEVGVEVGGVGVWVCISVCMGVYCVYVGGYECVCMCIQIRNGKTQMTPTRKICEELLLLKLPLDMAERALGLIPGEVIAKTEKETR